jgi:hypothetical protein
LPACSCDDQQRSRANGTGIELDSRALRGIERIKVVGRVHRPPTECAIHVSFMVNRERLCGQATLMGRRT